MFTGLVEAMGKVRRVESSKSGRRLSVELPEAFNDLATGESIAINGACLTVVKHAADFCQFDIGPETLKRTNLGDLSEGDPVNLERSLRLGDRLGGHLVQGHVDGIGRVRSRQRDGDCEVVWFTCPSELIAQMVPKGSVAIDGVSLTVVEVADDRFSIMLIPHTLEHTTLGIKKPGAAVNLETDLLTKYVWRCIRGGGVTLDTLIDAGFLPGSIRSDKK
jgi:riboflavin synthase